MGVSSVGSSLWNTSSNSPWFSTIMARYSALPRACSPLPANQSRSTAARSRTAESFRLLRSRKSATASVVKSSFLLRAKSLSPSQPETVCWGSAPRITSPAGIWERRTSASRVFRPASVLLSRTM